MPVLLKICAFIVLSLVTAGVGFTQTTETVLYSFGGYNNDGFEPTGGLVFDSAGNIYGTTTAGGSNCANISGCGTVFELSPPSTGWNEIVLYNFCTTGKPDTCADGAEPLAGLIFDKAGNLYGTTYLGGVGYGTVFEMSPPAPPGGTWTEKVLWAFTGKSGDGANPFEGKLNWDAAGNLYGTTSIGGIYNHGTIFELSPQPGGAWTETILYSFDGRDGGNPTFGVAVDNSGNLYGTTLHGGFVNGDKGCEYGCGTVYELSPSGNAWTYTVLYKFTPPGATYPSSPISIDSAGNLYGTAEYGGQVGCYDGCGGAFKLTPKSGGSVTKYLFLFDGQNGANPTSGMLLDEKGGVAFGTTSGGNNVYEIKGKAAMTLYQFCSLPDCTDGRSPGNGLLQGRSRELYGVTNEGGAYQGGVVFSISQ